MNLRNIVRVESIAQKTTNSMILFYRAQKQARKQAKRNNTVDP